MSDEIGNIILKELKEMRTEINGLREEVDKKINGLKDEIREMREENNKRFDILENELARNSEQHVVMNGEIKEIKDRLTRIEKEQEVAKRRDEQLATELKAEDALIIDCQKRSLINKYDIEQVKEKLAV